MRVALDRVVQRRQDAADRPRVDAAVGVPADAAVDRAGVQAGAAADALQALAERRRQHARPAVVQEDQVELLGPVALARPPRAGDKRRIHTKRLPRRPAGQELEEHRQVDQPRDHLLHAHQRDVDAGAGGGEPAVALVGHEHDRPRLGDGEVGAGDAHVRLPELLPQQPPADPGERRRVVGQLLAGVLRQEAGDALARVVHRRGDQVRRPLAGDLDDELAEVGLGHLQPGGLQRGVEVDLLGRHRLRLHDALTAGLLRDLDDDAAGVLGRLRPVDAAAEAEDGGLELFEVAVEVGEGVLLDALGVVAQLAGVGEGGVAAAVAGQEGAGEADEGRLQRRVSERLLRGAEEVVVLVAGVVGHAAYCSAPAILGTQSTPTEAKVPSAREAQPPEGGRGPRTLRLIRAAALTAPRR